MKVNDLVFGSEKFGITARDFRLFEGKPSFSQLGVAITGEGWALEAVGRDETLGVLCAGISSFMKASAARHWGSFVGLGTPEEVLGRVHHGAFNGEDPSVNGYQRWDMSGALQNYSLSWRFENSLGVEQAISVRGAENETLIWQTLDGKVESASVPVKRFDAACSAFVDWADSLIDSAKG